MPLPTVTIAARPDGGAEAKLGTYSSSVVKLIKGCDGARFDAPAQRWLVSNVSQLLRALRHVPTRVQGVLPLEEATLVEAPVLAKPAPWVPPANVPELEPYEFKTTPYAHQRAAMALAATAKAYALLMEMGTGKTKTTIDVLSYWMKQGRIGGAIVVCPKAVLFNWQAEFEIHSPLPADARRAVVLHDSTANKLRTLEAYKDDAAFFITNYAALLKMTDRLMRLVIERRMALVFDESTKLKKPGGQISKGGFKLSKTTEFKLLLTGTPITQGPLDAFAQFRVLDPRILGHHSYTSFKAEYAIFGGFQGREVLAYKNVDRLAERIKQHSYRVLKKDCLDLPEKVYRVLEVDLGPLQRAAYKMMRDEAVVDFGNGQVVAATIILTKMTRLQEIAAGYLPIHDEYGKIQSYKEFENPKLEACEEIVEDATEGGGKVIVWCRFHWELTKLEAALSKYGLVAYHGGTPDKVRRRNIEEFQNNTNVKVFLGQIQTAGIGINLTAASHVIYYSNTFSLEDRLQSEDRAHRIGQRNNVTYTDLVCRGTVDRYVVRALKEKKNIADVVTGDNLREVLGDA